MPLPESPGRQLAPVLLLGLLLLLDGVAPSTTIAAGRPAAGGGVLPTRTDAVPESGSVLRVDVEYLSGRLAVQRMRKLHGGPPASDEGGAGDYVVQVVGGDGDELFARSWSPVRRIVAPPPRAGEPGPHSLTRDELQSVVLLPFFSEAAEVVIRRPSGIRVASAAVPAAIRFHSPPAAALPEPLLVFGEGDDLERTVIVFLGDRYRPAQRSLFQEDVAAHVARLVTTPPLDRNRQSRRIKIYAGRKIKGLECEYECGGISRLICCNDHKVMTAAAATGIAFDEVVVLVNREKYGGSGGVTPGGGGPESYATAYSRWREIGEQGPEVMVHELGHSAFGLMDEYEYGTGGMAWGPNCAPAPCRWSGATLGCFPGCSYIGLHRPTDRDCLMNVLEPETGFHLCPVCAKRARRVVRRLAKAPVD